MRSWHGLIRIGAVTALAALAAGAATLPAGAGAGAAQVVSSSAWRARSVAKLGSAVTAVAVNPQTQVAFELADHTAGNGPFRLDRVALATGHVTKGPEFRASQLSLAGGYVWVSGAVVSGQHTRLVLNQVSPVTLRVIRTWRLTGEQPASFQNVPVATAAAGTVWVGFQHVLWRLNTRTGAIVARAGLRASLFVSDVAVNPAGKYLYVSVAPKNGGGAMREYSGRSGRLLASSSGGPLKFSVSGASLTATPGRVWASFRTGMAGQTIALRQHGLSVVHFTGGHGLFGWFMLGSTSYGAKSVWLGLDNGDAGCVNPVTGAVRSRGHLRLLTDGGELLGVSAARREVYALGRSSIIAISAPATCWH
jgi:hypothetical protein